MAKDIRLQSMTDEETANKIIELYQKAKATHKIDKILAVKSFITRIFEAQYEYELLSDGRYHMVWTTPDKYVNNVIYSQNQWPRGVNKPLDYIIYMVKNKYASPFGYMKDKHFNRTL